MYVVEWSKKQDSYHIQTLEEMVASNMEAFLENRDSDFIVIGVTKSHDEARKLYRQFVEMKRETK